MVTIENITESYYVKSLANKFILHGFNSDMNLDVLQQIKDGKQFVLKPYRL